jgi:hypothetical protein
MQGSSNWNNITALGGHVINRIFDHLEAAPPDEAFHFSRIARAMRREPWWLHVPVFMIPRAISGEYKGRL